MKGTTKAVIFDWGGVVAPNKNGGWVSQLAELLNIDFGQALELWRKSGPGLSTANMTEGEFWTFIQAKTGKQLPNEKSKIWAKGLAEEPYPEMLELIAKLKSNGIKVVVLSNTIEPMERITVLDDMYVEFDQVFLSHRLKLAKPDKRIFEYALKSLKLHPNECLFIDDSKINTQAAESIGIYSILATPEPLETVHKIKDTINN